MMEYFVKVYDKKITHVKQPLLEIKQKKSNIYLPPEFCILVGIPQRIRENKKTMADIRTASLQRPSERIESILELNKIISESKEIKEWSIEMAIVPDEIDAKVLDRPSLWLKDNEGKAPTTRSLDDTNYLRQCVL
jgi:hypothetical protein